MRDPLATRDGWSHRGEAVTLTGLWIVLVIGFLPAFYYATQIPYSIFDDFSEWRYVRLFSSHDYLFQSLRQLFLRLEPGRYRPTDTLYLATSYLFFGTAPALAHLARLCLDLAAVCLTYPIVTGGRRERMCSGWAFWLFAALFLFAPNVPEARIGTQEPLVVLFLAANAYVVNRFIFNPQYRLESMSRTSYVCFVAVFALLSGAKEPAFAPLCVIFVTVLLLNRSDSHRWRVLPLAAIVVFTFVKLVAASGNSYSTLQTSAPAIVSNGRWIFRECFSTESGWVVPLALLAIPASALTSAALRARSVPRSHEANRRITQLVFLVALYLSLLCMLLLAVQFKTIRYVYPLLYTYFLILAVAVQMGLDSQAPTRSPWLHRAALVVLVTFGLYYVGVNGAAWHRQWVVQVAARNTEDALLRELTGRLEDGESVILAKGPSWGVAKYYEGYRPYYFGVDYDLTPQPTLGDAVYEIRRRGAPYTGAVYLTSTRDESAVGTTAPLRTFRSSFDDFTMYRFAVRLSAALSFHRDRKIREDWGAGGYRFVYELHAIDRRGDH